MTSRSFDRLLDLHFALVALSNARWAWLSEFSYSQLLNWPRSDEFLPLEREANELFFDALGLSRAERWLVADLVHVRMALVDGKVGEVALRHPDEAELRAYGEALRDVLDEWLAPCDRFRHQVGIAYERGAGMVRLIFATNRSDVAQSVVVEAATGQVAHSMRSVRTTIERSRPGWLYFDRNLMMQVEGAIYLCKPMERVAWTRSQALADADRIITELVASGAAA